MKPAQKAFIPEFKAAGDDGTVTFVVARLNDHIDEDGDVTLSGYFGRQVVVFIPTHDWSHVPIGKGVLYETANEAIVDARFNLAIEAARDWHAAIKFDLENPPALQEYSYGYHVLPGGSRTGEFGGRQVRFLQPLANGSPGVDVIEVSPVMLGAAGRGVTRTLAAKHSGLSAADTAMLEQVKRDLEIWKFEQEQERSQVERAERAFLETIGRKWGFVKASPEDVALREAAAAEHRRFHIFEVDEGTRELLGHRYKAVDATEVSEWTRNWAKTCAGLWASRLKVAEPEVRWFKQDDEITLLGKAYTNVSPPAIALNVEQKSWLYLAGVAAHEVGHLAGFTEAKCREVEVAFIRELIELRGAIAA